MADKDISIGIKTAGASQAAVDIKRVDSALEGISNTAPKVAGQIDKVTDAAGQLGTGKSGYGSKGSAGNAALELSRAFEDAQYGIRGILNNIPSLIFALGGGAGLAGVISIAAVAASTLWTKFSGGATKAKEDSNDLLDTFKQLVDVYTELDVQNAEDREKAARQAATNLKNSLAGIDVTASIKTDSGDLQKDRATALDTISLALERIRLADLEKAISRAGGEASVKLAKEREEVLKRILGLELGVSDAGRKQALNTAQARTAAAGGKLGQLAVDTQVKDNALAARTQERDSLIQQEQKLIDARGVKLEEVIQTATRQGEILRADALKQGNYELAADIGKRVADEIESMQAKYGTPAREEIQLAAQAAALEPQIVALESQAYAAAEAQNTASMAMQEASRALLKLIEQQGISRAGEQAKSATDQLGSLGKDVSSTAGKAEGAISQSMTEDGYPNPVKKEAIDRIKKIQTDNIPDSEQGGELLGALQVLANSLTGKDSTLAKALDEMIKNTKAMVAKYEGLKTEITDLSGKINQTK